MTITKSIIVPYNDHDDATLSVSIAEASTDYAVENTQNSVRDDVYRSASTSTVSITGVVDETRSASCAYLFNHLLLGANIRFQLFSDAAATSQVYDSGTLSATWWTAGESYTWSLGSNDPYAREAPFRVYLTSPTSYRSYKWTFSGTPTYASYYQVSRIVVGKYMEFDARFDSGAGIGRVSLGDDGRTRGGSNRTNVGDSYATLNFDVIGTPTTKLATWHDIIRRGPGYDVVTSLFPQNGTRLEVITTRCGKLASLDALDNRVLHFTSRMQLKEN